MLRQRHQPTSGHNFSLRLAFLIHLIASIVCKGCDIARAATFSESGTTLAFAVNVVVNNIVAVQSECTYMKAKES